MLYTVLLTYSQDDLAQKSCYLGIGGTLRLSNPEYLEQDSCFSAGVMRTKLHIRLFHYSRVL